MADVGAVWAHFNNECGYCGRKLDRARREGHLDHADPAGGDHRGNRVLACATCNGDEKREESWETFLLRKDPASAAARAARIREWMQRNPPSERHTTPEIVDALARADRVIVEFGAVCDQLRSAVQQARRASS